MGGRGTKSFSDSSKQKWSSGIGTKAPGTLKEALGQKGRPYSISDSIIKVNPHFSRSYSEYSENCQRCVVAYELRRRGYNVTALATYMDDTLGRIVHVDKSKGIYEGRWKGAFRGAKTENVGAVGKNASKKVISNIQKKMASYGRGSRAVVQVQWRGGRSGHVFNIENARGKMKAVDSQTGKTVSLSSYIKEAKPGSVNIVRTDNLRVSDRVRNSVTTKRY